MITISIRQGLLIKIKELTMKYAQEIYNHIKDKSPHLESFLEEIIGNNAKVLDTKLGNMYKMYGDDFVVMGERLLGLINKMDQPAFDAFLEFTIDYLRQQVQFENSGQYNNGDFDEIYENVYGNRDVMEGFYFVGLFLAYAFMIVPYEKLKFFQNTFLPRLHAGSTGVEIGYGHGLYILEALETVPESKIIGYDISPFSSNFVAKLFNIAGITSNRYSLKLGDIRQQLPLDNESMDWCIFAEVMEHLPDPASGFREIHRLMKPNGILYTTTVIDTNHMDHIVNFSDDLEVDALITNNGFSILDKNVIKLNEIIPDCRDITVGLTYVCCRN
jgi:SAM-dependent methyltransferase